MLKNLLNRLRTTPAPSVPAPAAAPVAATAPAAAPAVLPDDIARADALIVEGNRLEDEGQLERAEALYREAAAVAPVHPRTHLNLGIVLAARGDTGGAVEAYERVLTIDPAHPFGNYNYARLAVVRGDHARAESLIAAALHAKPDFPQALVVQSSVLEALGQNARAVESLEAALRLQPDDAGAWFNLAILLQRLSRADAAEAAVLRALEGEPDNLGALSLYTRVLRDQGFATEALVPLRRVLASPQATWVDRSIELLLMLYADGIPADELFHRHAQFGAEFERTVPVRFERHPERGDTKRRLRVGYVSCDFNLHPVTIFVVPLLEQHDRSQVEVFCYSYGETVDVMTERVRQLCDQWRDVTAMSDVEMADAIHADRIDVLVDLVGHTRAPRPGVFSQRPAPVQVSWVGYLNTTGLTRMDFRLSDRRADPIELAQPLHTECLRHLPVSQWCYRPARDEAQDPVAPCQRAGHVTFGSFNAALKISSALARRWGELLARLPGSRLVVANINSERKRAALRREIAAMGVAADRVEFLARVTLDKYLAIYNTVDIALDSFPYGGGTTTFDALWMGVPVVTATGLRSVSRSAASLLQELGLDDWIAPSIDDYVDVALARAADRDAIAALRGSLRARLQASPLTDVARFTRDLESAYREMWLARTG